MGFGLEATYNTIISNLLSKYRFEKNMCYFSTGINILNLAGACYLSADSWNAISRMELPGKDKFIISAVGILSLINGASSAIACIYNLSKSKEFKDKLDAVEERAKKTEITPDDLEGLLFNIQKTNKI